MLNLFKAAAGAHLSLLNAKVTKGCDLAGPEVVLQAIDWLVHNGAKIVNLSLVVDPVIKRLGYQRIEMGTDPTEHGFINVETFERLHYSELAILDVTGLRPNCFIEFGYALGCKIP